MDTTKENAIPDQRPSAAASGSSSAEASAGRVDPGLGWRLLAAGERRQEGDEFKYLDEPWKPSSWRFVGWDVREGDPPVRRRKEQAQITVRNNQILPQPGR